MPLRWRFYELISFVVTFFDDCFFFISEHRLLSSQEDPSTSHRHTLLVLSPNEDLSSRPKPIVVFPETQTNYIDDKISRQENHYRTPTDTDRLYFPSKLSNRIRFPEDLTSNNRGGRELLIEEVSSNGTDAILDGSDGGTITTILPPQLGGNATSEETSRMASPDVQDIIDGIVKLLGGKVHNNNKSPPPSQTVYTTQQPTYNLFNPGKPAFTFPTPKPTRINNRGPPLFGPHPLSSMSIEDNNNSGPSSSFEAIPLEVLNNEFKLNKTKFGPPFPLSQVTSGTTAPYNKGIPLPESIVPTSGEYNNNNYNNRGQQNHPNRHNTFASQRPSYITNFDRPQNGNSNRQRPPYYQNYKNGRPNAPATTDNPNKYYYEEYNKDSHSNNFGQQTSVTPDPRIKFPTSAQQIIEDDEEDDKQLSTKLEGLLFNNGQIELGSISLEPTISEDFHLPKHTSGSTIVEFATGSKIVGSKTKVYQPLELATDGHNGLAIVTKSSANNAESSSSSSRSKIGKIQPTRTYDGGLTHSYTVSEKNTNPEENNNRQEKRPVVEYKNPYVQDDGGSTTTNIPVNTAITALTPSVHGQSYQGNFAKPTPPLRPGKSFK